MRRSGLGGPALVCVLICWAGSTPALYGAQRFQRGDPNASGDLNITDGVFVLNYLFLGGPEPPCQDAADSDDNGELNITDGVRILNYLFLGGPEPPAPFPGCGDDQTVDALGCQAFAPCPAPSGPPAPPSIDPPPSPTRAGSIELRGATAPGLEVRITGGLSPTPVLAMAGPDGKFVAVVELTQNRLNRIFAAAEDAERRLSAPATVEVIQDAEPPFVYIDEPAGGSTVLTDRVTVTGRVSDMLSGFLGLTVTVNGQPAQIAIGIGTNGTFERDDVPLALGANTIRVVAADVVGNTAEREVTITREEIPAGADRLEVVSGSGQEGSIYSVLQTPIVVRASSAGGEPLEGKFVTFEVVRSDGRLSAGPFPEPEDLAMTFVARTGADGLARAHWRLGGDAGSGNNRVKVTGEGLVGTLLFCASATPGPAAQINIGSGNNQRGEAGSPLAEALKAWVSDGCNGIEGAQVTFRVTQGTGRVNGFDEVTVPTSPTGHAQVSFVLGPESGNQRVEAQFDGNPTGSAVFTAYALVRDEARPTIFSGLVLDNASQPIGGAAVILEVPGFEGVQTTTDLMQGSFRLEAPGAGPASLRFEGYYATRLGGETGSDIPQGSFPSLTYEVVLVPNAANTLPGPVLLPPLDPDNAVVFDGTQDVVLRVKGVEGLEMRVPAGTKVKLRDGTEASPTTPVRLSLNQVHHDDVPMPMPDGAAPPFAWTLQPAGARFDPPLSVTYPNMSGLPAGAIAYFLTFNHDTGRFEIFASGHVAWDGSSIDSDSGSGITVAGWGCNCPPYSVTGNVQNCCDVAIAIFRGGVNIFDFPPDTNLENVRNFLRALDRNRVFARVFSPSFSAKTQLTSATNWFKPLEKKCKGLQKVLVGHSLGGDTVRLSDGRDGDPKIDAVQRYMIDPISRDLALPPQFGGVADCHWYQRNIQYQAPPNLVLNFLRDIDLTSDQIHQCNTVGCPLPFTTEFGDQFNRCIAGYTVTPPALNNLEHGSNHFTVVDHALLDIATGIVPLVPSGVGAGESGEDDYLDETWILSAGGQSYAMEEDGPFWISNVVAADQFGTDGPGSAPDSLSDNFLRLTGISTKNGVTRYAFSEPFQIGQNEATVVENLTFTAEPPPLPESVSLYFDASVLQVGQTAQAKVTGFFAGGAPRDLTRRSSWTIYRTSNASVLAVGPDGEVVARAKGTVFVTAVNDGATAVRRIDIAERVIVVVLSGLLRFHNGSPAAGARITTQFGGEALSDATGFFSLTIEVPVGSVLEVSMVIESPDGNVIASTRSFKATQGGALDIGVVSLDDADDDGIPDSWEEQRGLDSLMADENEDPDGDGLSNLREFELGTYPRLLDSDFDGKSDGAEQTFGYDPLAWDTDSDSMPDGWEAATGLDPLRRDAAEDVDEDGIPNLKEFEIQTDPLSADSPGAIVYVDDDAAAGGDGSRDLPFQTIQEAKNAAQQSRRPTWIRVLPGSYHEATLSLFGSENIIALTSEEGASHTVVEIGPGGVAIHTAMTIDGFTLKGTSGRFEVSGGIVANNVISNFAGVNGVVTVNLNGGWALVTNNVITGGAGGFFAALMVIHHDSSSYAAVTNNTIIDNVGTTDRPVGGLAVWHRSRGSYSLIKNNIVARNQGAGIVYFRVDDPYEIRLSHNLVWNNAGGDYVGFQGLSSQPGEGDLSADPRVIRSTDTYYLLPGSPCIDVGFAGAPHLPFDLQGDPWEIGSSVDIGSDEFKDTDMDGLQDFWEDLYGLGRHVDDSAQDPDGDGLTNADEYHAGTNPKTADTDGDGLSDLSEITEHSTDPRVPDTDADRLSDGEEVDVYHTSPLDDDTDGDGMPDGWEVLGTLNPLVADANEDPDADGLDNSEEYALGTKPRVSDTDGDQLSDGDEVKTHGTSPLLLDTDGDGLTDGNEVLVHDTFPRLPDTDFDGLSDGEELSTWHTDPLAWDTDGDGMPDSWEKRFGLDLLSADAEGDIDGDGVSNLKEFEIQTDPLSADSPGAIVYVDDDAAAGGDGSRDLPFQTIQEAKNAAQQSRRPTWIRVLPGSYHEATLSLFGSENIIALTSEEGASHTVVEIGPGGVAIHTAMTIDGFTLKGTSGRFEVSGGIVANNVISNFAGVNGVVTVNLNGGWALVTNNVITGGAGGFFAALMVIHHDSSSYAAVTNNTIIDNVGTTDRPVGGLAVWHRSRGSYSLIKNNIVARNQGAGIVYFRVDDPYEIRLSHNLVWNNAGGDYVGFQGLSSQPGEGDLSADPLFDAGDPAGYHQLPTSPCIDAGASGGPIWVRGDVDGEVRITDGDGEAGSIIDIGADEYCHAPCN